MRLGERRLGDRLQAGDRLLEGMFGRNDRARPADQTALIRCGGVYVDDPATCNLNATSVIAQAPLGIGRGLNAKCGDIPAQGAL